MASRGGERPVGTDGNDYTHREKVSSKYTISAETKKYVKYSIHMHLMMACLVIVIVVFHFGNIYLKDFIEFPEVPKPHVWHFIWLTSLVPAIIGYVSLNRSILKLMKIYYYGTIICGLVPILTTMLLNASDLWEFAQTKENNTDFHGFPVIVLWYMYLFVVVQIHAFGIYFSRVLIQLWSKKKSH